MGWGQPDLLGGHLPIAKNCTAVLVSAPWPLGASCSSVSHDQLSYVSSLVGVSPRDTQECLVSSRLSRYLGSGPGKYATI